MPSLSTLQDNFNDGVIAPDWGNSYGGATETGGRARVPCTTGLAGYQTAYSWTMAGASLFVKVVTVPAASTATEAYCGVLVNAPDIDTSGNRIGFTVKAVGNLLRMQSDTGLVDSGAVEITYDPVAHAFLRLRENAGTVYWDTSPDGSTWTNRRTLATPAWVTVSIDQCALDLSAHRDAGTADVAEYDLFNTLSNGAVFTGTATGSAQSAATVTGVATTFGTATGSALSAATVTGVATYLGTAAGSAQSDASVVSAGTVPKEVAGLAAGQWDLRIEQGATFEQIYDCTVDDPAFTWNGWSARSQIRSAAAENADLLLELTPYLSVAGGILQLSIPASVTQALTRNGRWDLEMVSGMVVVRLLQGAVQISPEVTR